MRVGIGFVAGGILAVCPLEPLRAAGAQEPSQGTTVEWLAEVKDWRKGLEMGPNGPIPRILVDQFGYRRQARKVAVVREPKHGYDSGAAFSPGGEYALVDVATRRIVRRAPLTPWNEGAIDPVSGDRAWWFEFSEVDRPGRYVVVDLAQRLRSPEFAIGDDVYAGVMRTALRTFYFQRAGFEKVQRLAGPWADKASHLGPGQDAESRPWPGTLAALPASRNTGVRDLRGGWYDAGDYNKYTSWTARVILNLLRAYAEHPEAFDDGTQIPESGNGIPDVLDEVKWGLEWLVRMQGRDGALLCVQGLDRASPPSAARGPSYYGPPTTAATLMGSAAFAYAARIYGARSEPELKAFSADLAARARQAWDWASSNPDVTYYNNDDAKQPGSHGLAAGQQEMDVAGRRLAKFEAALGLYELTGEVAYRAYLDVNYPDVAPSYGPNQWTVDAYDALVRYALHPKVEPSVRTQILSRFMQGTLNNADQLSAVRSASDPYLSPIKDYTWGSNKSKMQQARIYELFGRTFKGDSLADEAVRAVGGYVHYIHGVNPLGLVYLSNMGGIGASHSVTTMFHHWFAAGTRWSQAGRVSPGPAPGFLVGGPHDSYRLDDCCSAPRNMAGNRCSTIAGERLCSQSFQPPLNQPPLKSYLQFNADWPGNSWELTEPSTSYQASYILVLSALAR
ncbi:MAG: glycoside hydrolase family 9 protein [Hyphomicrobiaceae bacterium]|nr:glycoside hydrolase family 9 protein [Hyphomicrobiaceae bacterium]